MKERVLVSVIFLAILVSACSSYTDYPYEVVDGVYFDSRNIERIQKDKTLVEELKNWFGEPLFMTRNESLEEWTYCVVRKRRSVKGARESAQIVTQRLRVTLKLRVVIGYEYTSDLDDIGCGVNHTNSEKEQTPLQ